MEKVSCTCREWARLHELTDGRSIAPRDTPPHGRSVIVDFGVSCVAATQANGISTRPVPGIPYAVRPATTSRFTGEVMNKSELVKALADAHNLTQEEAKDMVNTFFDSIKDALEQGDRVEIRGFGSFKIKHYEGYKGRNPKTGEVVDVQPKRLPFFRAGKGLKEHLNK